MNQIKNYSNSSIYYMPEPYFRVLHNHSKEDIKEFLGTLEEGKNYVVVIEFIASWLSFTDDSPKLVLTNPILISKNSNPGLIFDLVEIKLNEMVEGYYLDDAIMKSIEYADGPRVVFKYIEITII